MLLRLLAVTVSSASTVFGCPGLVRFCSSWLSRSRPLLHASAAFGCPGLVRFCCFWLSRSRPLLQFFGCRGLVLSTVFGCRSRPLPRFLAVSISSAFRFLAVTVSSAFTFFSCRGIHGLVGFYGFWLSRSRVFCHGLVRFCCFWLSRSRPFLRFLAVAVSSAFAAFGCHSSGITRLGLPWPQVHQRKSTAPSESCRVSLVLSQASPSPQVHQCRLRSPQLHPPSWPPGAPIPLCRPNTPLYLASTALLSTWPLRVSSPSSLRVWFPMPPLRLYTHTPRLVPRRKQRGVCFVCLVVGTPTKLFS